jgi:purine-nucleoside phosphorylase
MVILPYSNAAAKYVVSVLRDRVGAIAGLHPQLAIVLGSGLGGLVDEMTDAAAIPYSAIPGFADIHVPGHAARLVIGWLAGVPVVVVAGRFHMYEGHPPARVGFPVRIAHAFGAHTLLVTNSAGGIGAHLAPGDLMIIEDQINMTGQSSLVGPVEDGDTRFPDMSDPYDHALRVHVQEVAAALHIPVKTGIYAGVLGPAYETRAEIRMLCTLGADAVGMSTVQEVITARGLSMQVAGISCITNMAAGLQPNPLDHADVLAGAARSADRFQSLVRGFVASYAAK